MFSFYSCVAALTVINQNIQVLPFVLRREKGSVLSELPPKVYARHSCLIVVMGGQKVVVVVLCSSEPLVFHCV